MRYGSSLRMHYFLTKYYCWRKQKIDSKKYDLFISEVEKAVPEVKKSNTRLRELLKESETNFPHSQAQAADFRANLRDILLNISETEQNAFDLLQNAIW